MKLAVLVLVLGGLLVFAGCTPSEPASDYKEPEQGSFKTPDQVPERAGRTKAEAGGGAGMGRSEGG